MGIVCFTGVLLIYYSVVHDINDCYDNLRLFIINLINNSALKLVNNCFYEGSKPNTISGHYRLVSFELLHELNHPNRLATWLQQQD